MLRVYLHKSFTSHAINHFAGILVLVAFVYIALKYPNATPFKDQYDVFGSPGDALSFLAFMCILLLVMFQASKGYLLYVPSTYISFDTVGISFLKFKKELRFITWEDIQEIDLAVESEWLLNIYIRCTNGEVIRLELSELWGLSITKNKCVNYNFMKLLAIADRNPMLMKRLIPEQVEVLYKTSVRIG
ncbi:MAG TPA: hypothetical protein VK666_19740 [Chryseolinea sp.]|nr:hypothetical protein [Chryseolinea sp.]